MNLMQKRVMAKLTAAMLIIAANVVNGEEVIVPGVDFTLKSSVIYYNSFSNKDTAIADIDKFKAKVLQHPEQISTGGVWGGYGLMEADGLSLKSEKLSAHNTRTYSFWFYFDDQLKPDTKGTFISNNGVGPHEKWNFVSVFIRSGPWGGLKEAAGITQAWGFDQLNGKQQIFDKKFRGNYPAKQWHHFALVAAGGEKFSTYIDGKHVATLTLLKRTLKAADNLRTINFMSKWEAVVRMDELIIFEMALSAEQIKDYYMTNQAMRSRESLMDN